MTTIDTDTLRFMRKEVGEARVNSYLSHQSKAAFAFNAAAAVSASGPARTLNEHVSRTLFGNSKRLDAAVWIAQLPDEQADEIWASAYAEWCRVNGRRWPGDIGAELRRFEALGMLQHVAPDPNAPTTGRTKLYRRLPSPLWDVFIMCDVVIAEQVGERKFYQPSAARTAAMIGELLEIRDELAEAETPTVVEQPSRREIDEVDDAIKARRRPRNKDGELKCSRCHEWKPDTLFSKRSKWQFKSWCKACMAVRQRQRYLSMEKETALNMVGLTFRVGDGDDVVGLSCAACGQAIESGDVVHTDARLVHKACMT